MSEKTSGQTPTKSTGSLPTPNMRRGLGSFFKDLQREAKQVSWPTPSETTRLTGTVLAVCFLTSFFLFLLTLLVQTLFKMLGVQ